MNTKLEKYVNFASFSHRFFIKFHDFLGINFRIDFFIDFWWKMTSKMVRGNLRPEAFFSSFSRPCLLCSFYVELGSLLAPFWRPLAHFGLPFAHFGLPFGSLLVSLGSLLVPFPSLLLTQGSIFSLLLYPVLIFHLFLNFPWNIVQNLILKSFSLKITFSVNQIVFSRSASNAPQQKVHRLL